MLELFSVSPVSIASKF